MEMNSNKNTQTVQSKFQLKDGLLASPARNKRYVAAAALDLDNARVTAQATPASKFGLETICGASCAVGAL
jgi:hypothetical protein